MTFVSFLVLNLITKVCNYFYMIQVGFAMCICCILRMKPYKSSKYTKLMWNSNYTILLNALKLINEGSIWILSIFNQLE